MARAVDEGNDFDDYKKRAQVSMKEKSQKSNFTLPEGDTTFRILKTPSDKARGSYAVWTEYYVHRNVGPKKWRQPCGTSAFDDSGSCWLCRKVEKLAEAGETKQATDMEKQKLYAVQIAVFDNDLSQMRGPIIWEMRSGKSKKSLSFKIQRLVAGKKGKSDSLDHETGYNYTINRTGLGLKDTVYEDPERDEEPSEVPSKILAKLKPFADVISQYDMQTQKNVYYNIEQEEGEEEVAIKKRRPVDEDEEEVQPKKKRPVVDEDEEDEAPPKKKKPVVEDDEEDDAPPPKKKKPVVEEDEEDLNYGDDEDEAPKKKKKPVIEDDDEDDAPVLKKKKPVVEDDEDEDEAPKKKKKPVVEDDEEEEDAPPKRRRLPADDEDEDAPPSKKKKPVVEEDEEEDEAPPVKKKKPVVEDDEEDEPPVKKRRPVDEDDDDDPPVKKKKRPAADDEDE